MDPFETVQVGRSDVRVTRLGLGGTGYAGLYAAVPEQQAAEAISEAYEQGIRYFDTAPVYGHGQSEERLGSVLLARREAWRARHQHEDRALSSKRYRRTSSVVITASLKLCPWSPFSTSAMPESCARSRRACVGSGPIEWRSSTSMTQMRTRSLSLGHDPKHAEHVRRTMEQTYPAVEGLRAQGAVRAIGIGMNQWEMLCDFATLGDFDCFLLAGRFTLLEQEPLKKLLPLCEEKSISIVVGGPDNSGILATEAVEGRGTTTRRPRPTSWDV